MRELITQVVREERLLLQHTNTMRMFFVLLVVMVILSGDKVIQFLSLLIP